MIDQEKSFIFDFVIRLKSGNSFEQQVSLYLDKNSDWKIYRSASAREF